jgi:hypothetical protein
LCPSKTNVKRTKRACFKQVLFLKLFHNGILYQFRTNNKLGLSDEIEILKSVLRQTIGCKSCTVVTCEHLAKTEYGFCYECPKYPCRRLKTLDKRYSLKYGMSMFENLAFIKENGLSVHRDNCLICDYKKLPHIAKTTVQIFEKIQILQLILTNLPDSKK